jgi:hypothetical protein
VNTWDVVRQQQLDRAAVDQLNAMAPYAEPVQAEYPIDLGKEAEEAELRAYLEEYAYDVADLVFTKQQDYGPNAISNAPGGALYGINVRLHDKLSRLSHLLSGGRAEHPAYHEPIIDTYRDVAGYALIAMLVVDGKW